MSILKGSSWNWFGVFTGTVGKENGLSLDGCKKLEVLLLVSMLNPEYIN